MCVWVDQVTRLYANLSTAHIEETNFENSSKDVKNFLLSDECNYFAENGIKCFPSVSLFLLFSSISVTLFTSFSLKAKVDCVWNVMAHAQRWDFVFRGNGRVHLNRRGRQFSRLLATEVCASAVVMLDVPCSEVVWRVWLPTPFASFPFTSPPVRHRVPTHFNWTLHTYVNTTWSFPCEIMLPC
jgi:hypothetical protein